MNNVITGPDDYPKQSLVQHLRTFLLKCASEISIRFFRFKETNTSFYRGQLDFQ